MNDDFKDIAEIIIGSTIIAYLFLFYLGVVIETITKIFEFISLKKKGKVSIITVNQRTYPYTVKRKFKDKLEVEAEK